METGVRSGGPWADPPDKKILFLWRVHATCKRDTKKISPPGEHVPAMMLIWSDSHSPKERQEECLSLANSISSWSRKAKKWLHSPPVAKINAYNPLRRGPACSGAIGGGRCTCFHHQHQLARSLSLARTPRKKSDANKDCGREARRGREKVAFGRVVVVGGASWLGWRDPSPVLARKSIFDNAFSLSHSQTHTHREREKTRAQKS